ncbi:MAG: DUF748 domain-containing protein [Candidatus Edwardsbacteria bacterium]|nr:DUF748 domain-containing protein [Candidatus Edwardsbacteria bacterium]
MNYSGHPDDRPRQPEAENSRGHKLRRLMTYAGYGLGGAVLAGAALLLIFNGALLNGYGKRKLEHNYAATHPGSTLRIGKLYYVVGPNRLVARSVTLSTANSTYKAGRISLTGVRWSQFLLGKSALVDAMANAGLDASKLDMEFLRSRYGIRCKRLQAMAPNSELTAEGIELSPLAGDEEICAANPFRTTRYTVTVPECRISGLDVGEILQGKSYRARSVIFIRPAFDAFAYHEKPSGPFVKSPLMVNQALAAIRLPVRVDSLSITGGWVAYRDRVASGAAPGVLTFTEVDLNAEGITNRGQADDSIVLRAQGKMMDAGLLKMTLAIPAASTDLSFKCSGSLGAMDLTRLGPFLSIVEHYDISSGRVERAEFEIDVASGRARGRVRANFSDLTIAVLDKTTGSQKGLGNRIASFLANQFKIRGTNSPEQSAPMKVGRVSYRRKPGDTFLQVVWYALKSGVLDVIHQ